MDIARKALLLVLMTCSIGSAGEAPFVSLSFEDGLKQAQKDKKVVFVDFYTTWCTPCKIMAATTFKDAKVVEWLAKNTVALKIDAEKRETLAEKYRVEGYPTLLFIKPDGAEMDRIVQLVRPDEFLSEAADILTGKDPLVRAKEKLEAAGKNRPMARMAYAGKLAQLGKYEEALKEYLWCFDEGVERDKAFVGVRYSFLLTEIEQLAYRYEPALDALRERRDRANTRVTQSGGSAQAALAVGDLAGLNEALGEQEETLKLYDRLRVEHPDWPVVAELRHHVFELLLESHRYGEIVESADIDQEIERIVAKGRETDPETASLPEEQRKRYDMIRRQMMVGEMGKWYQVLLGLKKADEAAKLAERALDIDRSAAAYNILAWEGYVSGSPVEANLQQARKANELAEGKDASIIDTLARLLHALGHTEEACTMLARAVKPLEEGRERGMLAADIEELGCGS